MPSSATTASSPIHLSSPDKKAMQVVFLRNPIHYFIHPYVRHRFIDRRDAHHDLWASEEIQAKYRDWPHDPKDQRFEALTERIQSLERRVYGVKAAYYDGSPTVLVVIEDNQPLPVITALDGSPDQVLDGIELDRFKKRYESLQESLPAADVQHKRVSVQIERYEGLALGDTAIGHIRTAFHGYAERDLSTTPKAISLDNKHIHTITDANPLDVSLIKITDPSFIPKNMWLQPFESIKELCPGQEVFMDCTAASKEQTGEVGLLKGYFGLPHPDPNPAG
ncbi:hypothetical protein F5876DRAFT_69479 [Lentinula aff. lateritia]|uniref:Uncharacterized protein n=1 Tax=Lentinula aff. lateritia TaxID=2804960 RepID=A0ACC1TMB5_9AGAR|nr:hypothetical protein F5876DRAFT_69479 [Lentinula aff. lateritia]